MSTPIEIAKVEAMCTACLRGYVWINPKRPKCLCGGEVIDIEPIPNEIPYCYGKQVHQFADGTRPKCAIP